MVHFAELNESNIVTQVVVVHNNDPLADLRITIGTDRGYAGTTITVPTASFPDINTEGETIDKFTGTGSITF